VGRTVATGLTTLGLAGLLIGVIPGQLGSSGAALNTIGRSVTPAGASADSGAPGQGAQAAPSTLRGATNESQPSAAASAKPQPLTSGAEGSTDGGIGITGERPASSQPSIFAGDSEAKSGDDLGSREGGSGQGGPNYLILFSLGSLGVGVGLFALRRVTSTTAS
jgi:hypothetical protein